MIDRTWLRETAEGLGEALRARLLAWLTAFVTFIRPQQVQIRQGTPTTEQAPSVFSAAESSDEEIALGSDSDSGRSLHSEEAAMERGKLRANPAFNDSESEDEFVANPDGYETRSDISLTESVMIARQFAGDFDHCFDTTGLFDDWDREKEAAKPVLEQQLRHRRRTSEGSKPEDKAQVEPSARMESHPAGLN